MAAFLLHDAVRPLVSSRIITDCLAALREREAVDVVIPSADTIVVVGPSGTVADIPARENLRRGQTPQGFRAPTLRRAYDLAPIRQWLNVFVKRYFGFSQFKRSAKPNGPKVSAGGSLSPRGDWRAPSDGNAAVWLAELERNVPTE